MKNEADESLANLPVSNGKSSRSLVRSIVLLTLLAGAPSAQASASASSDIGLNPSQIPAWVFPMNPPAPESPAPYDKVSPLHIPNSKVSFTEAELNDLFKAPDWHPDSHSAMPSIVANGRPPDVYACGFCHTAGGQGRPENASLAGLPAAYILSQLADFRSGARKSAWSGPYRPADLMIHTIQNATAEELSTAATFFAAQSLLPRVVIVETERVPRSHIVGWVYAAEKSEEREPLGQRLLEFAPDPVRHENRDDEMRYIAYVPPGSIDRGRHIAQAGADSPATACNSCHGPELRGVGLVPPIAGRSPTYILRQLLAFQTGARTGATGLPMRAVVKNLRIEQMIDAVAYAGSLTP